MRILKSIVLGSILAGVATLGARADDPAPLRILFVTGGGWHDFETQKKLIADGLAERIHVDITIDHEAGNRANHEPSRFRQENWTKGFDLVIHSHGLTNIPDHDPVAARVADEHRASGVPAVVIHNTLHSLRNSKQWHELMGVTSRRHTSNRPRELRNVAPKHPIMRDFGETWSPATVELYIIDHVEPGVTILAECNDEQGESHPTFWTHQYGKAKVFGSSIGHDNRAVGDRVFLDTLARGILWATGKLDAEGNPLPDWNRGLK